MFELNNLAVAVPTPVEDFFLLVSRCRGALCARLPACW